MLIDRNVPGEMLSRALPLLSIRNLSTHFYLDEGVLKAVDNLSFDVYPGQVVGIIGESGCGKSTIARSILRLVDPPGRIVAGEVLLRSCVRGSSSAAEVVDLMKLRPESKALCAVRGGQIALIPQEPAAAISPVHTIGNQLVEVIRLHQGLDARAARRYAIGLLGDLGVAMPEQRIDAYAWELSIGLLQRVLIALALAGHPRVLIADEPTTAIDVTTQAQVFTLLKAIQQRSDMAIILISHDLDVIAQVADYVVVMYLGCVVEAGTVDALYAGAKHPYTQALLCSRPSIQSVRRARLPVIAGSVPSPLARPAGCPFHPRCAQHIVGRCDRQVPVLQSFGTSSQVRCFLYDAAGMEEALCEAGSDC